jgi:allophanate hydrolase
VSTRGVVPACRSLDCVSVFATCVADAWAAYAVIAGEDAEDPFSRPVSLAPRAMPRRIGVPRRAELDGASAIAAWDAALARLQTCGVDVVQVDMADFHAAAARSATQGPS